MTRSSLCRPRTSSSGRWSTSGTSASAVSTSPSRAQWLLGAVTASTRLTYTYQKAQDLTDPSDSYYGGQIPYIPWHSGSAIVTLGWRGWELNYSFIYTGERYDASANIREN